MLRWYCGYTHPNQETIAKENLDRQGFENLLLMHYPDRKRPDYQLPLFRRYIFIRFDVYADPWRRIYSTKGMKRLLCDNPESPLFIDEQIIEELRVRLATPDEPDTVDPFRPDTLVRFRRDGALVDVDLTGIVRWSDSKRVAILADMMGREVEIITNRSKVWPV